MSLSIDDANAAYKAAQAKLAAEQAKLNDLVSRLNADSADFSSGAVRYRGDPVICRKANDVQTAEAAKVAAEQLAVETQDLVVAQATVDKNKAKLDLQNAVRDSDVTNAVEQT